MNEYIQYDSVDFAQDDSFVRWVKEENSEDETFWQEWISNHPDKKEEVEKAIIIVKQIVFEKDEIEKEVEERVWSGIHTSVTKNTEKTLFKTNTISRGKIISLASIAAVAAMLIFFLMVGVGSGYDTTIQTQYAEMETIKLPDGSLVYLNADSDLEYNTANWIEERTLNLEGEAFFEVKKGSQFMVKTKKGNVTVLGTSFNVYQRSKDFKVHCKTGKVSVFAAKNTSILTANQSVSIPNQIHQIEKDISPSDNRSNWKNGIYTYRNESIEKIAKELERQLDLNISLPEELKKQLYTGSFSTTDKETALSEVFWPLDMEYTEEGRNIIVTNKAPK